MRQELLRFYDDSNDIFGYPQEYKGILFYPILLKDLKYQNLFYQIFTRPKNYIASVEILKASFLKFIIWALSNVYDTEENAKNKIIELIAYMIKMDKDKIQIKYFDTGLEGWDGISIELWVGDKVFTEDDFENIREIVLQQNNLSIEYIEAYNPELEPILEYTNKQSRDINLSDQVFTFCAIQKLDLKTVENYTLFQFNNLMERVLNLKEYDTYKPALMSGNVTLKGGGDVKHYFYHSSKTGRYDSISVDVDSFSESNKDAFN